MSFSHLCSEGTDSHCWWFRNPKQPPGMYKTIVNFMWYSPHQLVQDFSYQQYDSSHPPADFIEKWLYALGSCTQFGAPVGGPILDGNPIKPKQREIRFFGSKKQLWTLGSFQFDDVFFKNPSQMSSTSLRHIRFHVSLFSINLNRMLLRDRE